MNTINDVEEEKIIQYLYLIIDTCILKKRRDRFYFFARTEKRRKRWREQISNHFGCYLDFSTISINFYNTSMMDFIKNNQIKLNEDAFIFSPMQGFENFYFKNTQNVLNDFLCLYAFACVASNQYDWILASVDEHQVAWKCKKQNK